MRHLFVSECDGSPASNKALPSEGGCACKLLSSSAGVYQPLPATVAETFHDVRALLESYAGTILDVWDGPQGKGGGEHACCEVKLATKPNVNPFGPAQGQTRWPATALGVLQFVARGPPQGRGVHEGLQRAHCWSPAVRPRPFQVVSVHICSHECVSVWCRSSRAQAARLSCISP